MEPLLRQGADLEITTDRALDETVDAVLAAAAGESRRRIAE